MANQPHAPTPESRAQVSALTLTHKQERFAQAVADGMTQADGRLFCDLEAEE